MDYSSVGITNLQNGINFNDPRTIQQSIGLLINQRVQVEVSVVRKCNMHPNQNNYFSEPELYFCVNFHTSCLDCLQSHYCEQYLQYRNNCEYYCLECDCLLYQPIYKNLFLQTIFGSLSTISSLNLPNQDNPNITNNISSISQFLFELNSVDEEYKKVEKLFFMPLIRRDKYSISNIYRNSNPVLLQKFDAKKKELEATSTRVVKVWHGTGSLDIYKKICEEGFKIGGKDTKIVNGVALGNGVNTGKDPHTCLQYTQKCGYILLCDGLPGLVTTDLNNGEGKNKGNSFESGNVYIFFDSDQVYPKYLLKLIESS